MRLDAMPDKHFHGKIKSMSGTRQRQRLFRRPGQEVRRGVFHRHAATADGAGGQTGRHTAHHGYRRPQCQENTGGRSGGSEQCRPRARGNAAPGNGSAGTRGRETIRDGRGAACHAGPHPRPRRHGFHQALGTSSGVRDRRRTRARPASSAAGRGLAVAGLAASGTAGRRRNYGRTTSQRHARTGASNF